MDHQDAIGFKPQESNKRTLTSNKNDTQPNALPSPLTRSLLPIWQIADKLKTYS